MNKKELTEALVIAKSNENLFNEDLTVFDGCGLSEFQYPVHVTIRQVARLMRWQAVYLNGDYDSVELDNVCWTAKKKFMVIG